MLVGHLLITRKLCAQLATWTKIKLCALIYTLFHSSVERPYARRLHQSTLGYNNLFRYVHCTVSSSRLANCLLRHLKYLLGPGQYPIFPNSKCELHPVHPNPSKEKKHQVIADAPWLFTVLSGMPFRLNNGHQQLYDVLSPVCHLFSYELRATSHFLYTSLAPTCTGRALVVRSTL